VEGRPIKSSTHLDGNLSGINHADINLIMTPPYI